MSEQSLQMIPTNPGEAGEEPSGPKSQARKDYESGLAHLDNKEYGMAANALHNALVTWQEEDNQNGIANASDKMADLLVAKGNYEKALEYYDKAYEICSTDFDRYSLISLENKKANVFAKLGRFPEAIELYMNLFDEYSGNRDAGNTVAILETLADLYISNDQKDKAADCYTLMASIHLSYKHRKESEECEAKAKELLG
ncbi:MAG: tetratricopeptide repeat protein [Desulfobulbaceae bacterium]|jgi:tetratricopeptide (TPR) repeat protein|nr:tetratricopeptide repeat protein [Desulfobulbaceae bacterium]